MTEFDFDAIASRLTKKTVFDLDSLLRIDRKSAKPGGELVVRGSDQPQTGSSICWPLLNPDRAYIGVRISGPVENPVELASALIAITAEREITPIIMSHLELPDFGQFGFRIERIAGSTARDRAICEDEILRFYGIAVVVDAENLIFMK